MRENGIENPIDIMSLYEDNEQCLWISQSMKEASYPLAVVPKNVLRVGPIYLSTASVEQQDVELATRHR